MITVHILYYLSVENNLYRSVLEKDNFLTKNAYLISLLLYVRHANMYQAHMSRRARKKHARLGLASSSVYII